MFPPSHQNTLTFCALVCAAFLIAVSARADSIPAHCVYVHDGDTITVKTQAGYILHVRLAAIDAPELKQPLGDLAAGLLTALVAGQDVQLKTIKLDRYGRTIARVFVGTDDVGLHLLCDGHVWLYPQYLNQLAGPDRKPYLDCATNARDTHMGIFASDNPTAPWSWRKGHPLIK